MHAYKPKWGKFINEVYTFMTHVLTLLKCKRLEITDIRIVFHLLTDIGNIISEFE